MLSCDHLLQPQAQHLGEHICAHSQLSELIYCIQICRCLVKLYKLVHYALEIVEERVLVIHLFAFWERGRELTLENKVELSLHLG